MDNSQMYTGGMVITADAENTQAGAQSCLPDRQLVARQSILGCSRGKRSSGREEKKDPEPGV